MKEFWVEIAKTVIDTERIKLLDLAKQVGDVVLKGTEVLSSKDHSGMCVLSSFDEQEIASLKRDDKEVAVKISIAGKRDEDNAVKAAELGADYVILNCQDWRVIPLENLIARTRGKSKLIAEVTSSSDARVVLEALELGTDGVLLKTSDPAEITKTAALIKAGAPEIVLATAKVTSVKQIGTGARVCVDTCDLMTEGEGILVGCQSAGFFLVEAEVHENPYVLARPFRVNAGPASQYTLTSPERTRYLSELKAGDEVMIVNRQGRIKLTNVGRVKIELRPLMLVEAEVEGSKLKTILQNAETIHVVTPQGSKPVTELQPADEVIVHLAAKGGRHFGVSVPEETVIER